MRNYSTEKNTPKGAVNNLMSMVAVQSSNIASLGHNPEKKELYIKFNSRATYKYFGVDKKVFNSFLNAESIGKFFHANIKNSYKFEMVNDGKPKPKDEVEGKPRLTT